MSGEHDWRWAEPDGQQRLVRTDELRAALASGMIPPNAPVWREGWQEWKPAFDVPELSNSGGLPDIPPPPMFVVAAQDAFEGSPRPPPVARQEPPPPPRYVPAPVRPPPSVKVSNKPPLPAAASRAPSVRPPISQRMSATEALKRAVPSSSHMPISRPATPQAIPVSPDTQPDVGARAPAARPTPRGGLTVPTVVGVPRIADPRASAPPLRPLDHTPLMPTAADRARPDPSRSTLLFDGTAPSQTPRSGSQAPPIIAPGSGGAEKNAVTRPPPVDMGIMQVSPGTARTKEDSSEELSGSMLIEHTDHGPPKISQPSKPPPMPSKRPGLRALASGRPGSVSRPPAPPLDGYPSSSSQSGSTATVHGAPPALPVPASKPATPPPSSVGAAPVAPVRASLSPPTLMGVGPIPSPGPPPADLMAQMDEVERGIRASVEQDEPATSPSPSIPDARLPWMEPILERFPRLRPLQVGRPVFFLPVVGGLTALVALVIFGLLVRGCLSLFSGDDKAARRRDRDKSPTEVTTPIPEATTAPPEARPAPVVEGGPVCRPTNVTKTLAPKALVPTGVEAIAFPKTIGVGFAISPKEGVALEIDPVTLAIVSTARARGTDLKRVTPLQTGGRLVATADVDKRSDALVGGRTIGAASPFELGLHDGQLAWSQRGGTATPLWPLAGDAPVEAPRGAPDAAGGFALAFRRGTSIFAGALNAQMKPIGSLVETRGFGTQVGSPSVAASGGSMLVMWADRASTELPWSLRMRRITGTTPEEPQPFAPAGGPGAPFIAPSLVGLGGGRFLVVWTEGPAKSHQVRGATLDASGKVDGAPFALSPATSNAGQAQAALGADGRGAVMYLVSSTAREGFELAATSISCAP